MTAILRTDKQRMNHSRQLVTKLRIFLFKPRTHSSLMMTVPRHMCNRVYAWKGSYFADEWINQNKRPNLQLITNKYTV